MTIQDIYDRLVEQFGEDMLEISDEEFARYIIVRAGGWFGIAQYLAEDPKLQFDSLMCLTGVDYGPKEDRMEVVYDLHSMTHKHKLSIKIQGPREEFHVPSVESVWRTADWHEREAYDMFGIIFDGHRNLKRLLLPQDWEGHPLKKDYEVQEYYHGIRVPKVLPKRIS